MNENYGHPKSMLALQSQVEGIDRLSLLGVRWIIAGRLCGCAQPGAHSPIDKDLHALVVAGVTYLITLTKSGFPPQELAHHGLRGLHAPIFDVDPVSMENLIALILHINKCLDTGEVVAVHCRSGIGRTGVLLAAWMLAEEKLSAREAIQKIRLIDNNYMRGIVYERTLDSFVVRLSLDCEL